MAKRVLIVDDAAFMRMMIKDILTKNGYEVAAEAENGKVAVSKYQESSPDLTLLDITMPEMDGIQANFSFTNHDRAFMKTEYPCINFTPGEVLSPPGAALYFVLFAVQEAPDLLIQSGVLPCHGLEHEGV